MILLTIVSSLDIAESLFVNMRIINIHGDILLSPPDLPIIQAVSLDGKMGAGLAKLIQTKYCIRNDFLNSHRKLYSVVPVSKFGRLFLNVITKEKFYDKPTEDDVKISLCNLRTFMISNNIKSICAPKFSCGLDGLNYNTLLSILFNIFGQDPVTIYMHHI